LNKSEIIIRNNLSELEYNDYWFDYVIKENPQEIKNFILEEYLDSQGYEIHLDIYEKERSIRSNIIFIHGTSVYSRFYPDILYRLSQKGYRIIAPDLPGHGRSSGLRGHFTLKLITKIMYDVNTYCKEKFGNSVYIMGSSLGGIAALYCSAYDERIKGVICHNAAILNEKAYKEIINVEGIIKLLVPFVPILAKIFPKMKLSVWKYLNPYDLAETDKILKRVEKLLKDPLASQKYTLTSLRTQMKADLAKPAKEIRAPILLITGENDKIFSPKFMRRIYDCLPPENTELKIIKKGSHLIFQEHIEESLEIITSWLGKIK